MFMNIIIGDNMTGRYIITEDSNGRKWVFDNLDPNDEPMSAENICNDLNRWYLIAKVSTHWLMSDECNLTDGQIHRLRKEIGYD